MNAIYILIGLLAIGGWLFALVHAYRNPMMLGSEKLAWILVIVFGNCLGAFIYFVVAEAKRREKG